MDQSTVLTGILVVLILIWPRVDDIFDEIRAWRSGESVEEASWGGGGWFLAAAVFVAVEYGPVVTEWIRRFFA
jgi:hypothetical protein